MQYNYSSETLAVNVSRAVQALKDSGFRVFRSTTDGVVGLCTWEPVKKIWKVGNVFLLAHLLHFFTSRSAGSFSNFDDLGDGQGFVTEIFVFGAFKVLLERRVLRRARETPEGFRDLVRRCISQCKDAKYDAILTSFDAAQAGVEDGRFSEEGRRIADALLREILTDQLPKIYTKLEKKFREDAFLQEDPMFSHMAELKELSVLDKAQLEAMSVDDLFRAYTDGQDLVLKYGKNPHIFKFPVGRNVFYPAIVGEFDAMSIYVVAIVRVFFLLQNVNHLVIFYLLSMLRSIEGTPEKDQWGEDFKVSDADKALHGHLGPLCYDPAWMENAQEKERNPPKLLEQSHRFAKRYLQHLLGICPLSAYDQMQLESAKALMLDIGMDSFVYVRGGAQMKFGFTSPSVPGLKFLEDAKERDGIELVRHLSCELEVAPESDERSVKPRLAE